MSTTTPLATHPNALRYGREADTAAADAPTLSRPPKPGNVSAPVSVTLEDMLTLKAAQLAKHPAIRQGEFKPMQGFKQAGGRLIDALGLFALSNILVGPGHIFMLPVALAEGAIAVNEFRKASGLKPLMQNEAAQVFTEKAKRTLDIAKVDARQWEKPFKGLYKIGFATLVAGALIHPLLLVGFLMLSLPVVARDIGLTVSVFRQLMGGAWRKNP
jgi:hypothetical protein